METEYEIHCKGKVYESIDAAIEEYLNTVLPDGSNDKLLDKILKAINLDIFENLAKGITYLKTPVAKLSVRTIKKKGHAIPFLDKGILLNQVKDEMLSENRGIVYINDTENRDEIASILHHGSKNKNIPARPFFELSDSVLTKIDRILLENA